VNSLAFNCVSVTYYRHYSCIFRPSTLSYNFRSSIFWSSIFRSRIFHLVALPQILSSIFQSRIFHLLTLPQILSCIFQSCIFRLLFFFGPSFSGPAFSVHPIHLLQFMQRLSPLAPIMSVPFLLPTLPLLLSLLLPRQTDEVHAAACSQFMCTIGLHLSRWPVAYVVFLPCA